jgi:ABC-type iron transport system FetAB ATPase subunit
MASQWESSQLVDKAPSGLDNKTQKRVKDGIAKYMKMNGMDVLWVRHNKYIAERLLSALRYFAIGLGLIYHPK